MLLSFGNMLPPDVSRDSAEVEGGIGRANLLALEQAPRHAVDRFVGMILWAGGTAALEQLHEPTMNGGVLFRRAIAILVKPPEQRVESRARERKPQLRRADARAHRHSPWSTNAAQ